MPLDELTSTERALVGGLDLADLRRLLEDYARARLGSSVAAVIFRSGRSDAVWGVGLEDGREVVIKIHRPPVDLVVRAASVDVQQRLGLAGFPCPTPISGPDEFRGMVLSTETLTADGEHADGRDPATRRAIATGLARHIAVLSGAEDLAELIEVVGKGPAWNRYEGGPWPTPHDTIFDFTTTPEGFGWLDRVASEASRQIIQHRGDDVVVGHGDWYGGNLLVRNGKVSATYDWDLIADSAGDRRHGRGLLCREFNARCELSLLNGEPAPGSAISRLREHHRDYLALD